MNNISIGVVVIMVIVLLIAVFILLRELNCWYWKINERIELQKRTNDLLEKIISKSEQSRKDPEIKQIS